MKKLIFTLSVLMFLSVAVSPARGQAYSSDSNEGLFGLYNLLEDDLGCGPIKNLAGTVSGLKRSESDGTSIYSFNLTAPGGKRQLVAAIISDDEIAPREVTGFLVKGRKVRLQAQNCDGQMTAVEIIQRP
jgi:hypothetical protein